MTERLCEWLAEEGWDDFDLGLLASDEDQFFTTLIYQTHENNGVTVLQAIPFSVVDQFLKDKNSRIENLTALAAEFRSSDPMDLDEPGLFSAIIPGTLQENQAAYLRNRGWMEGDFEQIRLEDTEAKFVLAVVELAIEKPDLDVVSTLPVKHRDLIWEALDLEIRELEAVVAFCEEHLKGEITDMMRTAPDL